MFKLFNYLRILDEKFFTIIADFKNSEFYSNLNQKIITLDEPYQKLIQTSSFCLILFLPIIVSLFVFTSIYNSNTRISQKKEVLELIDVQLSLNKQVETFNNTVVTSALISSEEDFKNAISSNPLLSVLSNKISYSEFNQSPLMSNFKDSLITLKFNEISTPDLANVVSFFYEEYKARIVKTSINRDSQKKLLQGEVSFNIISN